MLKIFHKFNLKPIIYKIESDDGLIHMFILYNIDIKQSGHKLMDEIILNSNLYNKYIKIQFLNLN